jgi:hypothetical protein
MSGFQPPFKKRRLFFVRAVEPSFSGYAALHAGKRANPSGFCYRRAAVLFDIPPTATSLCTQPTFPS